MLASAPFQAAPGTMHVGVHATFAACPEGKRESDMRIINTCNLVPDIVFANFLARAALPAFVHTE